MKILWVKTELLHPVDKGGRIRTYQMLREISREHHVTYLTLDDGDAAPDAVEKASEYSSELVRIPFSPPRKGSVGYFAALATNIFSSLPYAVSRYRSRALRDAISRLAPKSDVVVCDFLAPAVNMPARLPVPTVLFQHNVEAMIWQRHAGVAGSPTRRAYMREQYRRMSAFESRACAQFSRTIAVSSQDANEMRTRYGATRVSHVATGVDVEYFTPGERALKSKYELVFTGSMDWMPNDDAMLWFLSDILPRIRSLLPSVSVTVVGRSPSQALQDAASKCGGVTVTGRVPDVRPFLERGSLFIVPMRVGGGTRLKIFEAMAMGIPVVSTSIGAEGLPLDDGETIVLRDEPADFAAAVIELLGDDASRVALGAAAMDLVRSRFGWQGVAREFVGQCIEEHEG